MIAHQVNESSFVSLFVIAACAMAAPLLSVLTRRRIPDVVWLLVLGVLVGPHGFGWAGEGEGVGLIRELGLGLLFLLAGFEVDAGSLRGRQGRWAMLTWLVSLGAGWGLAALILPAATTQQALALAICVSSTALGTLLPILKEAGTATSPLGHGVLTHGAVGELGPVVTMSVLLGSRSPTSTMLVFAVFVVGALLAALVPARLSAALPSLTRFIVRGTNTTLQTMLRVVFLLLTALMALTAVLGLDIVLGAFVAGAIVRVFVPRDDRALERKLTVVGYSFLIPVFFVTSGMTIDVTVVARMWPLLLGLLLLILVARGVPVWLAERAGRTGSGITSPRDQVRLGLYSAAGLPIIVAVTDLAVAERLMSQNIASVLVAAGAATVLVFPFVAHVLANQDPSATRRERAA